MENIILLGQTAPWLSIIMIVLAMCLGIIFYLWSIQIIKKIELLIIKMKQNVDNLEYLSQYIYEIAYFKMKENNQRNRDEDIALSNENINLNELKEVKKQIQYVKEMQMEINQKLNRKADDISEKQQEVYSNKNDVTFPQSVPSGEEDKYKDISELIIMYLKELLREKEQVTAQELVYAMPNQYSLADIYRTLEIMKERNQISWKDKSINPQSSLRLP
ncbi:MAG: hypothetical protein PHI72_07550 [Atribacterota bacterium]|jgi:hypothetical protein|nr:hypothetical protein [Atribacterota bacterium]MDD4895462.1 hypothetical protein [Atribacterota bacterium]MDD5637639.1 hypothetical protein [Atribacterota bacterium]